MGLGIFGSSSESSSKVTNVSTSNTSSTTSVGPVGLTGNQAVKMAAALGDVSVRTTALGVDALQTGAALGDKALSLAQTLANTALNLGSQSVQLASQNSRDALTSGVFAATGQTPTYQALPDYTTGTQEVRSLQTWMVGAVAVAAVLGAMFLWAASRKKGK